jgi:hypothetical protein
MHHRTIFAGPRDPRHRRCQTGTPHIRPELSDRHTKNGIVSIARTADITIQVGKSENNHMRTSTKAKSGMAFAMSAAHGLTPSRRKPMAARSVAPGGGGFAT